MFTARTIPPIHSPASYKIAARRAEAVNKLGDSLQRLSNHYRGLDDCDMSAPTLAGFASLVSAAAMDVQFYAKQIADIDAGNHPLAKES